MKITTTSQISGSTVVNTIGLVRGNTIRVRHLGRDIMAGFRLLIGGEVRDYTKIMGEAREQAIDRMIEEAGHLGLTPLLKFGFPPAISCLERLKFWPMERL